MADASFPELQNGTLNSRRHTVLFTTAAFICLFLPVTLVGFFVIARTHHLGAALWLLLASVFFYGYWMPEFTMLLLGSVIGNFLFGTAIAKRADSANAKDRRWGHRLLVIAVTANLALLAYYKYANFFVANLDMALGVEWNIGKVVLPIGISFFTFTQIAFLVDTWRKGVREYKFIHYGLFVTYFPHLIAGPVLHHAQMMPQFKDPSNYRFNGGNFSAGLSIFALGMFKKVVLADGISPYADAIFNAADTGGSPDALEAWLGAVAYSLQLYFDFSGYSDMAIGLSWMFNVRLPFNFDSPYKAASITEFWRRWHMTLSQFLRDYLYIALGGNRRGVVRRYANLMTTMVLGGLWHGASWSFIIWGFLHGLYLAINHGFRAWCGPVWRDRLDQSRTFTLLAWLLTMLAVVIAWVLFRAETLAGAWTMLQGMAQPWASMDTHIHLWNAGLHPSAGITWCVALAALACLAPNTNRIGDYLLLRASASWRWRVVYNGMASASIAFLLAINSLRDSVSAFIYFNF